jgi:hypothetical protein
MMDHQRQTCLLVPIKAPRLGERWPRIRLSCLLRCMESFPPAAKFKSCRAAADAQTSRNISKNTSYGRLHRQADRCFIAHEGREVSGPEWALALREESQSDRPSKMIVKPRSS